MLGALLLLGMGFTAGIAFGATKMGKDAETNDREIMARKRVETIRTEGQCDYRCKGCPVELLCLTKLEKGRTTQDCVEQWLRDRGYLEQVSLSDEVIELTEGQKQNMKATSDLWKFLFEEDEKCDA